MDRKVGMEVQRTSAGATEQTLQKNNRFRPEGGRREVEGPVRQGKNDGVRRNKQTEGLDTCTWRRERYQQKQSISQVTCLFGTMSVYL